MRTDRRQPAWPRWFWALAALAIVAILLGGYAFQQMEARQLQAQAEANLAAIAKLKARQIADWRTERLGNGAGFTASATFAADVADFFKTHAPETASRILGRLAALDEYQQYRDACLVDPAGQTRLSLRGNLTPLEADDQTVLAAAFSAGEPIFRDLHFSAAETAIRLEVIAPLFTPAGQPLGALVLSIDPQHYLYPLLETWPVPSASAESLLVRREGDAVVWLNNLRQQPDAALKLHIALSRQEVPAVVAVLGKTGVFAGTDYRGVAVFSALEPVPGSPWFLVAKEDSTEALASLPTFTALGMVGLALLLAMVGVAIGLVWQQAQKRYYRTLYAAEAERLALARHFEYLVKYANDIIVLADAEQRLVEANDRALAAYAYSREEMLKLNLADLGAPQEAAQYPDPLRQLLTTGTFRGETQHRRRDGSIFAVEVSFQTMDIDGHPYYQGIFRDITDRKQAEMLIQAQTEQLQTQNEALTAQREELQMQNEELTAQREELQTQNEELIAQQDELQQAAIGLRESEARFRALFEGMTEGVCLHEVTYSPQGRACNYRLLAVNPQYEATLNLQRGAVVNRLATEVYGTPEAPYLAEYSRVAETGQPYQFETYFPPLNKHFLISVAPMGVARFATIFVDITERKRAEEALRESEERFRAIVENTEAGYFFIDTAGFIRAVNPAWVRLYRYDSAAEVLGQHFAVIQRLEDMELAQAFVAGILRGDRQYLAGEFSRKCRDGSTGYHSFSARPVSQAGHVIGIEGFILDITERKRAEEALRRSEEKLRAVLDATPFPIALVDLQDEAIQYWSRSALALFGHTAPTAAAWYQLAYPDPLYRREVVNRWKPFLDIARGTQQAVNTGEYRVTCSDGSVRVCELYAAFLPDNLIVTFNDITERKQAEMLIQAQREQLVAQNEELVAQNEELVGQGRALAEAEARLQEANASLEHRIQERSAELRAANAALLRAGRLKDEFLANMSHELRTPLTGILGLTEVMEQGIYGDLSDKQRNALKMVRASGEHLLQLINDILDLSKVEAGKVELQCAPVDVEDACRASLEFVQQIVYQKHLTLTYTRDEQVRQLQADGRRLRQMLVNLLSNAVKFTPENGEIGLEVTGDLEAGLARLAVWDTGIGIPPEKQPLLFQPFVQLDSSLARKYEGTGLGLALVHALAELHGGRVTVASAGPGLGSRFTLSLPWLPVPPGSTPTWTSSDTLPPKLTFLSTRLGRRPVILAADDNPVTLKLLTDLLEASGCQVITAANGQEALEQAQAAHPDLLVLDVQMPDLDGLTVIRRLRAAGTTMPIIALTALAMPSDREHCLAAGANDYLSKPVNLAGLTQAIGTLLASPQSIPPHYSDPGDSHERIQ